MAKKRNKGVLAASMPRSKSSPRFCHVGLEHRIWKLATVITRLKKVRNLQKYTATFFPIQNKIERYQKELKELLEYREDIKKHNLEHLRKEIRELQFSEIPHFKRLLKLFKEKKNLLEQKVFRDEKEREELSSLCIEIIRAESYIETYKKQLKWFKKRYAEVLIGHWESYKGNRIP